MKLEQIDIQPPVELDEALLGAFAGGQGSQLDPDGAALPRGAMIDPNG